MVIKPKKRRVRNPVTAFRYVDCLRPFLDRRITGDGLDLESLTPTDVASFVMA
jgi:hypothetical protein